MMGKIKALVLIKLTEDEKKIFTQFNNIYDFTFKDKEKVLIERKDVEASQVIIGYPPRKYLKNAHDLKWIQMISSGVDKYMKDNILLDQTTITNAKGSYGEAQSEFMFAMLLSIMKKLNVYRDNQSKRVWNDEGNVLMLRNSRAIVVGLGDIGSEFAKILKAFGVYVVGVRRDINKKSEYVDEIYSFKDFDSQIPNADIIVMVVPSTKESENLMSKERISLMKKSAVLVNTGRGSTIDNEALFDAIEKGDILGAALDVFENEPLDKNHRAWGLKNLLITPHSAGQDYMQHNWKKTLKLIEENLLLYSEDKQLKNIVDRNIYEFK